MKALIHIGMPKTGTSSIQAFLGANAGALAQQSYLYAPFNPLFGSQYEFAVTALQLCGETIAPKLERNRLGFETPQDQADYVADYQAFLSQNLARHNQNCAVFIGSSEHIYAWMTTPERISALDRWLQTHFSLVEYLVYLRPQADMVASGYSEAIRRGATHDFDTHLTRHSNMDYWMRLQQWRAIVGPRLSVGLMVPDAMQGGDLLQDFCARLGIRMDGLVRPAHLNTALPRKEMALRRQLNRILAPHRSDGLDNPAYRRILRLLRPFLARDKAPLRLTETQVAQVHQINSKSNERVRETYFPDRKHLF